MGDDYQSKDVSLHGSELFNDDNRSAGAGFFEAKGVVETLLAAARVEAPTFAAVDEPFLHPGRSASVLDGFVGELHPEVAAAFGLEGTVAVFELGIEGLRGPAREQVLYRDVTSFPPLRQDIAVVVDEDVPAGRVVEVVRGSGGPDLAEIEVFDVYRGAPVPEPLIKLFNGRGMRGAVARRRVTTSLLRNREIR